MILLSKKLTLILTLIWISYYINHKSCTRKRRGGGGKMYIYDIVAWFDTCASDLPVRR